jgi:hypothetical protein
VCGIYRGKNAYGILVGKTVENRPLKRIRSRREDNIKMNLQ